MGHLSTMGTLTGVTVPYQALQAVLQATAAPYPASQIPLALGFDPFSIPLLSQQPGTGSSRSKTQKGSWGSLCAAVAPAQGTWLGRPCATDTSVLLTQQLPPHFVTAAVSQDMATVPARKGTFYPAETDQQFKWGNVITHTSIWPSNGICFLRGEHSLCLLEAVQTLEMKSHMSRDALTIPGRS